MSEDFEKGQVVRLKSNPDVRGSVISVIPGARENRYKILTKNNESTYYASQLEAEEHPRDSFPPLSCEEFHARLTALQIRYPALSNLYSLNAARIDFIPYQFRPVFRFIRSDRPRLLIADGVGVGKTIEAGLILRELQARSDVSSVLIVCPRPLVAERKWENEMKRFEEQFVPLDGKSLRYCIDETDVEGKWPERYRRAIVPYSLFDETLLYGRTSGGKKRKREGLLDLDPPPNFDLVIVDEAHHIRNTNTFNHQAVKFFCDNAEAAIFLTATPIQLDNQDLFVLLQTLRPDLVIDEKSFEHMSEPNSFINRAVDEVRYAKPGWESRVEKSLVQAAETSWGQSILRHNPDFQEIQESIRKGDIRRESQVRMINDIENLYTFSGIINRTRRRDIGQFTVRDTETARVEFTPAQKDLHDELIKVQAEILGKIHGDDRVNFMMTTLRRQAASCIFGLEPTIEDILKRHLDKLPWSETDIPQSNALNEAVDERIRPFLEEARSLDSKDPKLEALRDIIKNRQKLPNKKVMIFSSFLHTLRYLYKHLKAEGFRIGKVYGGTPDEDRSILRNRFAMSGEREDSLDILLFSEVGSEGLDYQFCDCIVNYDLPWNPMKIEQRIGRIDRHGQKSEKVAVINFVTLETVDADIYERCLERIGIFQSAIGGNETILGEVTKEISSIAKDFSLDKAQRREKLRQLADNKIRLIEEQNDLEQKQLELFGIKMPQEQINREIEEASSFWLSPASLQRLVTLYLQKIAGQDDSEFILGEKPLKTLRLSKKTRNVLKKDFQKLPHRKLPVYTSWRNWLRGDDPHLQVTFESGCAAENQDVSFITPVHPLVRQSAEIFFESSKAAGRVYTVLKVQTDKVPAGVYKFAIYRWCLSGIKEDLILQPVALSDEIAPHLVSLLEKAVDSQTGEPTDFSSAVCDELDEKHYDLWNEARRKHSQRTREVAEYRKESLSVSHKARKALLNEQIERAGDEKIRRMRMSQINTMQGDYEKKKEEIENDMKKADITAEAVGYGIIEVEGSYKNAKRL